MPDKQNGLLLVLMEPPADMEEEFHAWYDTEHIPERATLPGFQTALRYVCLSGYPRFMAIYDLDSEAVLDSPEYAAVSGDNFSPWTKRVTSRVQVSRIVARQIFPGDRATIRSARIVLVRFAGLGTESGSEVIGALRTHFDKSPSTQSVRVFSSVRSAEVDYYGIVEMSPPTSDSDFTGLGTLAEHIDLVNVYTPRQIIL